MGDLEGSWGQTPSEPKLHTQEQLGESSLPLTQHSWGHLLVAMERVLVQRWCRAGTPESCLQLGTQLMQPGECPVL